MSDTTSEVESLLERYRPLIPTQHAVLPFEVLQLTAGYLDPLSGVSFARAAKAFISPAETAIWGTSELRPKEREWRNTGRSDNEKSKGAS
jgi:hypothetical protein